MPFILRFTVFPTLTIISFWFKYAFATVILYIYVFPLSFIVILAFPIDFPIIFPFFTTAIFLLLVLNVAFPLKVCSMAYVFPFPIVISFVTVFASMLTLPIIQTKNVHITVIRIHIMQLFFFSNLIIILFLYDN